MGLETLNGRALGWNEVGIEIDVVGGPDVPMIDIKSIKHGGKVERGEQRGASGGRVRKRTTGQVSSSGSGTFYADGLETLKEVLTPIALARGYVNLDGHVQLSKVSFNIVLTFEWADDPAGKIRIRKLIDCHLDGEDETNAEGTDALTVDVDLNPRSVVSVINGVETVLL